MGASSELGPIDPQFITVEDKMPKRFSVFNVVESYNALFKKAVAEKGHLEPYLQQLARYDERQIKEFFMPKQTKVHGRPIFMDEAKSCGLKVDIIDIKGDLWQKMYELYIRTNNFVLHMAAKCIESKDQSFVAPIPK